MSVGGFSCCSECGRKLHTTFFCQGCGQACCCLDCYCRHEARHARTPETAQLEDRAERPSDHLEPAR
jgi:hypothetical protein